MMRGRTTRASLRRLLVALVAAGVAVLATTAWVLQDTRAAATGVQLHSVPSIMHVMTARAALVDADAAAIQSFRTGEVRLTGPGERYQNAIAVAGQSLTQLAQDSTAGAGADQTIQLVEGLVVAYVGLIEQADAHYRQEAGSMVGTADLWYASRLLHMPDGGILAQLDGLRDTESRALADHVGSPRWVGVWMVPLCVLLVLLLLGQVYLSRTFRRTLNVPLVAATLVVIAVAGAMAVDFDARHEMRAAREASAHVTDVWRAQMDTTDQHGQVALQAIVQSSVVPVDPRSGDDSAADQRLTAAIKDADGHAARATDTTTAEVVIALLALLALALVPVGLYKRFEEYR